MYFDFMKLGGEGKVYTNLFILEFNTLYIKKKSLKWVVVAREFSFPQFCDVATLVIMYKRN